MSKKQSPNFCLNVHDLTDITLYAIKVTLITARLENIKQLAAIEPKKLKPKPVIYYIR